MESYDLARQDDRLAVADLIFTYSPTPHQRKHGPRGYSAYESYRDWLRDEFSYRCVFSLIRETWSERTGNFDIDHIAPQVDRPDLAAVYDNLIYLRHGLNLVRGKKPVPDPCTVALGQCLRVITEGDRVGFIDPLNDIGQRVERILRLNSDDMVTYRKNCLGILRSAAMNDEALFRRLIGYPDELPNLHQKRVESNGRENGLKKCAHFLRESGKLPEWY